MVYKISRLSTICLGSSIFELGIVITLFFRCLSALLNAVNCPRGTIKWPLVAHTVVMFSILTASIALFLDTQSIAFVDNRNTPSDDGLLSPGPEVYQDFHYSKAGSVALATMVLLNTLLVDGLLVSLIFKSVPQVFNMACSFSSAVAILSIP